MAEDGSGNGSGNSDWYYYDDSLQLSDLWQTLIDEDAIESPSAHWRILLHVAPDANTEKFSEFWRCAVPQLLAPSIKNVDEAKVQRVLIDSLEAFLDDDLAHLAQRLDAPAQLCAKVFNLGDPIFCCRDCSADSTCVMCSDCFAASKHVKHK